MTTTLDASLARPQDPLELAARWAALRDAEPKLRQRNAAERLGVSEGELIATRVGADVIRLTGPWQEVLEAMPQVGGIMALTRNPYCVIEKDGRYDGVNVSKVMGVVLDPEIDLRLFFAHWHHGLAVSDPDGKGGVRRSLQFFDRDGTAVHKVFATGETLETAWDGLIERFRHADQSPGLEVRPAQPQPETVTDDAVDVPAFQQEWRALTDTHHFFGLLRRHQVERRQALRLAPEGFAVRVRPEAADTVLREAAASGLSIMVFVGSPGCIEIHTGPVRKVVKMGPWLNVLDPRFQLHLREDEIDQAWIVRKPTDDGVVTSLELFAADGTQIAQFFGERKPGKPERDAWRSLADRIAEEAVG